MTNCTRVELNRRAEQHKHRRIAALRFASHGLSGPHRRLNSGRANVLLEARSKTRGKVRHAGPETFPYRNHHRRRPHPHTHTTTNGKQVATSLQLFRVLSFFLFFVFAHQRKRARRSSERVSASLYFSVSFSLSLSLTHRDKQAGRQRGGHGP